MKAHSLFGTPNLVPIETFSRPSAYMGVDHSLHDRSTYALSHLEF